MGNSIPKPVARFEDFEVNLDTGEMWKAGRPLKVQDQPFRILTALLERQGQVVTREELRQLIWPENNFGDFDHAIWWSGSFSGWQIAYLRPGRTRRDLHHGHEELSLVVCPRAPAAADP
jgi:hypothetical protein